MAVPEQTPYIEYTGNGTTASFALNFDCESKDHLIVLVDEIEPPIATWSLSGGNVVFTTAPTSGQKIIIQRNTPFSRTVDYQSYNNSFRPPAVNKDFDWIWLKLQELGVADWILSNRIEALKNYVDDRDDELRAYLMEEIRKQGVALDQLDEYYNYLMQRLAQIAVDKGWDASFVVDGDKNQKQINAGQLSFNAALAAVAMISESNTWQQNRDIIQAVNDALYQQKGGGKIQLPPGDFVLKGVLLDSGVKVQGNNTNIRHPDNYDVNIFETKTYSTTGNCAKDSFTVTVADASKFEVGSLIAVQGAGGISRTQNTSLANSITATDTTNLKLSVTSGFLGAQILQVENELITCTSISGDGTLVGVQRGLFGTTAVSHVAGVQIGIAMRHVSEILAINGNTITLFDAAKFGVSNANVLVGGQGCRVDGVNIYGERQLDVAGWRWSPFRMRLHRNGGLNYYAENCENGFNLEVSSDNDINFRGKDLAKISGSGGVTIGAGGWLFQQCHRNKIDAKIIGDSNIGVYLDNKTNYGTEWDEGCNGNHGSITVKYSNASYGTKLTVALGIVAGNDNEFTVFADSARTSVTLGASSQAYNTDGYIPPCRGNTINVSSPRAYRSVICDSGAIGNTFIINQGTIVEQPIIDEGNLVLSSNEAGSVGNYLRFRDGTYARPGLSFRSDPTHGFWRSSAGDLRLSKNNLEQLRFTDGGLYFPDGKIISTGSGAGLKIGGAAAQPLGFYGVTPIVQPSIGGAASDAATTQTLVNSIRAALINLGLAKT